MMPIKDKPLVVVIAGPTAIGKTAMALWLAKKLHTEIISADSRQCYQEMSIGTAKPTQAELAQVPHYFINTHSIRKPATAFDFEQYALAVLEQIFERNKVAIVCGGSGLYIDALCDGLDEMPQVDKEIAAEVENNYREKGLSWLQETTRKMDPYFFQQTDPNNPARLLRALSFFKTTGKSLLTFQSQTSKKRPFKIVKIALDLPREEIYKRINGRVDDMMKNGLMDEVESLMPLHHLKPLNTVGYSELFEYFLGNFALDKAVEKIKQHTRNYAKRQLTWLRKDERYHWRLPENKKDVLKIAESFLVG